MFVHLLGAWQAVWLGNRSRDRMYVIVVVQKGMMAMDMSHMLLILPFLLEDSGILNMQDILWASRVRFHIERMRNLQQDSVIQDDCLPVLYPARNCRKAAALGITMYGSRTSELAVEARAPGGLLQKLSPANFEAAAVCLRKSLERGDISQNLYPELGLKKEY